MAELEFTYTYAWSISCLSLVGVTEEFDTLLWKAVGTTFYPHHISPLSMPRLTSCICALSWHPVDSGWKSQWRTSPAKSCRTPIFYNHSMIHTKDPQTLSVPCPPFSNDKTKTQRSEVTTTKTHSQLPAQPDLEKPSSPNSLLLSYALSL